MLGRLSSRSIWQILAPVALGLATAGCGNAALPTLSGLGGVTTEHAEPPVEIYSRIARGALRCWFGAQGSLKKAYVFHADVAPDSAAGGAEIAIYERDKAGQGARAVRAMRITIARSGGGSNVQLENFRMPEAVAADMGADVNRFVQGQQGCSVIGLGGWQAEAGKDEPSPESKPKKADRKAVR